MRRYTWLVMLLFFNMGRRNFGIPRHCSVIGGDRKSGRVGVGKIERQHRRSGRQLVLNEYIHHSSWKVKAPKTLIWTPISGLPHHVHSGVRRRAASDRLGVFGDKEENHADVAPFLRLRHRASMCRACLGLLRSPMLQKHAHRTVGDGL
jgi:hypothetical protein